jgi:hypothetical protein
MKNSIHIWLFGIIILGLNSCKTPPPEQKVIKEKHNYIILLDLSDRIIVQDDQINRDKEIIKHIYNLFQERVKKNLYIKSRDEIRVVIAPQSGSGLKTQNFEDRLYINMKNIDLVKRRKLEAKRQNDFFGNIDTLYKEAKFSDVPTDYYGADIWKYFYENLQVDYSVDTLTKNFLFILTDGYPVVGENREKLKPIKDRYPELYVVLVEAAPWDKEGEWDNQTKLWSDWFNEIGITHYTLIKRMAISKEKEQITDVVERN